ncbi:MAG: DNA polymerase II large subunit, partial [Candidatus Njordarchaeota archaeon]
MEIPEIKIPEDLAYPEDYAEYFRELINKTKEAYKLALLARSRGLDPDIKPEISLAYDLASRVEAMVGPKGIAKRIRDLQDEGKELEEIAVIIAREIAQKKWTPDEINDEKVAEQAIRTALAIVTNGIVAAPLEGIVKVKIRPERHLAVYYAGPIRSAGGTETALSVLIADIVRRGLNLKKYEPTQEEVERMVEEIFLYKRYKNLQYPPNREKIIFAMKHIPIEVNGEGTDKEVQIYRNVRNVDTPKIRGGAVLVMNDGFIAKAKKLLKIIRRLKIDGWDWLEDLSKIGHHEEKNKNNTNEKNIGKNKTNIEPNYAYMRDAVIGRPIFSSPMKYGGFRLRYGRSRNTGLAAVGVHPITMLLLDSFLAVGTQIKPERPGKGAIVLPVDSIEPPIVKLDDGSVIKIENRQVLQNVKERIVEILFLGDMLIAIGEFLENNHVIIPSPIVEEWWIQELESKIREKIESI